MRSKFSTTNRRPSKSQTFMVFEGHFKIHKAYFLELMSDHVHRAREANTFTVDKFDITKS